jgi:cytochrome c-type biogenesis protein
MISGINIGLAFLAGILSFISPCVLPLIPSYLSLIAGTSFENLKSGSTHRKTAVLNTLFFVLGFSVVFITLGVILTGTLGLLGRVTQIINLAAGIIIILLGLNFIFDFWKILSLEKRFHIARKPTGLPGSMLIGMAFGAGWSPCIGPMLGAILLLAGTTGKMLQGILLLTVYSIGLGVPFLLTGYFFTFALRQMQRIKLHLSTIRIFSGIFLVVMGILILLGRLQQFNILLFTLSFRLEQWQQVNPHGPAILFGIIFFLPFALLAYFYWRRIKGTAKEEFRRIRPVRIIFMLFFLTLAILSFSGLVRLSDIITLWLNYQGI